MQYWIIKSPFKHHSWSEILFSGNFQLFGIRNYQARNNIKEMEIGDIALFYSSSNERKIFGIIQVIKKPYQDPSTTDNRWLACDFKPLESFAKAIPLKKLRDILDGLKSVMFKQPRLSVIKIDKNVFDLIKNLNY